jgi:hypothetical protein
MILKDILERVIFLANKIGLVQSFKLESYGATHTSDNCSCTPEIIADGTDISLFLDVDSFYVMMLKERPGTMDYPPEQDFVELYSSNNLEAAVKEFFAHIVKSNLEQVLIVESENKFAEEFSK